MNVVQPEFQDAGYFLLRTPALSFQARFHIEEELNILLSSQPAGIDISMFSSETIAFIEAVVAESPAVADTLYRQLTGEPLTQKKQARLKATIDKYLYRMTNRPTPRGLLSGVAIGCIGDVSAIKLRPLSEFKRIAYPDPGWMLRIERKIYQGWESSRETDLSVNPLTSVVGDHIYTPNHGFFVPYEEGRGMPGTIRLTPFLCRVMELSKGGIRYQSLIEKLCESFHALTSERAAESLVELLHRRVLLTNILPPPTSDDPLSYLESKTTDEGVRAEIHAMRAYLSAAGGRKVKVSSMDELRTTGPHDEGVAQFGDIRTDLEINTVECSLKKEVVDEAARAATILLRVNTAPRDSHRLEVFAQRFIQQYESYGELVPLMELLDSKTGIGVPEGYNAPLGQSVPTRESESDTRRQYRDSMLINLAASAMVNGADEIELSDADLAALEVDPEWMRRLPPSMDLFCSVAAESPADIDDGNFRLVFSPSNVGNLVGGSSLTRFQQLFGEQIREVVNREQVAQRESYPDEILAELVLRPELQNEGTVSKRPQVFRTVIAPGYTARDFEDGVTVLPVEDLAATVIGNKWIIYDLVSGKPVRVVAHTRLTPFLLPAPYRFLLDVASQNENEPSPFDWGAAANAPYLPRLVVGRAILSLRTWNFTPRRDSIETFEEFAEALRRFARQYRMPELVMTYFLDHRTVVDINEDTQLKQLYRDREKAGWWQLIEVYPTDSQTWVEGEKRYHSEFVFPLIARSNESGKSRAPRLANAIRTKAHDRKFESFNPSRRNTVPGGSCLYVRFSAEPGLHDDILAGALGDLLIGIDESPATSGWFFLRYKELYDHLRVRIFGDPLWLHSEILPQLSRIAEDLQRDRILKDMSLDTYRREVLRYGGEHALDLCEKVFRADSRFSLNLIRSGAKRSFKELDDLAVWSMFRLSEALGGRDYAPKYDRVARETKVRFQRKREAYIRRCDHGTSRQPLDYESAVLELWAQGRARIVEECVIQLEQMAEDDLLTNSMEGIRDSLMHMHVNRLFGIDREREVEYNYLTARTLGSFRRGRKKNASAIQACQERDHATREGPGPPLLRDLVPTPTRW